MKVVYATATVVVARTTIQGGTHWPADDPVVLANPGLFSEDPRWGLSYSVPPEDLEATEAGREKRSYVRRTA